MEPITLGLTGHRPHLLGGYDDRTLSAIRHVATSALIDIRPDSIITGMAQGWDTEAVAAALSMGIPVHAYIPTETQAAKWPPHAQRRYAALLSQCDLVRIISPDHKGSWGLAMHARNEAIVKNSTKLAVLWNKEQQGGTWDAIQSAIKHGIPFTNYWTLYEETRKLWLLAPVQRPTRERRSRTVR